MPEYDAVIVIWKICVKISWLYKLEYSKSKIKTTINLFVWGCFIYYAHFSRSTFFVWLWFTSVSQGSPLRHEIVHAYEKLWKVDVSAVEV